MIRMKPKTFSTVIELFIWVSMVSVLNNNIELRRDPLYIPKRHNVISYCIAQQSGQANKTNKGRLGNTGILMKELDLVVDGMKSICFEIVTARKQFNGTLRRHWFVQTYLVRVLRIPNDDPRTDAYPSLGVSKIAMFCVVAQPSCY